MVRAMLLRAAARAKAAGQVDAAMRYNPWARRRVLSALVRAEHSRNAPALTALTRDLTAAALGAAGGARYGKGRSPVLEDWPVLEKPQLAAAPEDFVNRRHWVRFPAGTGGTTGAPLRLWRSLESIAAEQVFLDRLLAPYGFNMRRARIAVLRGDSIKAPGDNRPPFGRFGHGGRRLLLSSQHLRPDSLPWYEAALRDFAPDILWVYPNAALNLLTLTARAGLDLAVPVIMASSEMLPGALHEFLAAQFRARIVNYYGQAERVCLAVSTRPGEFYFEPCYGRVEFGAPTADDDPAYRCWPIIGTNYWNPAMPLIRYHIGDLLLAPRAWGAAELAEVALGLRPFAGLAGREGEYLLTRDGMRIIGLNQIPREISHVLQLQLVQTDCDNLVINVAALPGFDARDAAAIMAQARAKIPASIAIRIEIVPQLITNERGKAPFVIRRFG